MDLFPLKDLYKSAKWLYEGGLGFGRGIGRDKHHCYDSPGVGYDRLEDKREELKEVVVKTEPVDYMTQNQLNAGVPPRVPKQFPRPPVNVFAPASMFVQPAPSGGLVGFPALPPTGCRLCGTLGHFIRECLTVEEYQRSSKAICNGAGQVTLPNRAFILRQYQGATLRNGFDNFYNQNPVLLQVAQASRAPEVTMNFILVGVEPVEEEDKDAEVEAEVLQMLAAIAQSQAKKQAKFDGVVVSKPASQKGPPGVLLAAGTKTVPTEEVKGKGREPRQFKYQAPAEDKELIQAVIDCDGSQLQVQQAKEILKLTTSLR